MPSKRIQKIASAMVDIRKANGGRLTATAVVLAAKPRSHPLHNEFIWDDRKAAHLQRIDRARELISCVELIIRVRPVRMVAPMYVRDPLAAPRAEGYSALTELTRASARKTLIDEIARISGNIDRGRSVAMALDQKFPGTSNEFELLLRNLI